MKKLSLVLVLLLICSMVFVGCGKKEEKPYDYDLKEYVTLGEFPNVKYDADAVQKAIDEKVKEVASKHKVTTEVEGRSVKKDDVVNIDYEGKIDGEVFEGGSAKGFDLTIGSGKFIAGFEDGLIGKNKGDVVELNLKFPENYDNSSVAGKDVVFKVTINKISEPTIPPLSDDMVKNENSDDYVTVDEFLAYHRKNEAQTLIWDNYLESCEVIKYPDKETKEYYNATIETYKMMAINYYGKTLSELVSAFGYATMDDFFSETLLNARKDVREEMIIYQTARANDITISDEEYNAKATELATQNGYETVKEFEETVGADYIKIEIYKEKIINKALEANGINSNGHEIEEAAE